MMNLRSHSRAMPPPLTEVLSDDPNAFVDFATHVEPPADLQRTLAYIDEDHEPWLCHICKEDLYKYGSIECDECIMWFHGKCVGISNEQLTILNKDDRWVCPGCPKSPYNGNNVPSDLSQYLTDARKQSDVVSGTTTKPEITLPAPVKTSASIDEAVWGVLKGKAITEAVNHVYSKIVKWKRNIFKVPTGKTGQDFIDEVNKTIGLFVSGSHFESVALTMSMIIFPLLLQKPSRSSKSKDHTEKLVERLALWRSGELNALLKHCTSIQDRLKSPRADDRHHEKVFARLMLQGKVSAALRWVGSQRSGLLEVDEDVLNVLKEKHPAPGEISSEALLKGPAVDVEDVIFDAIDADLIHKTAKNISGAAGPSGADAEIWQRILCSKQFKKKPDQLCTTIAELAKKLSSNVVDPDHLSAYTAGRLIPLDKKPGVRPIGVGEVLRRIVGKAITTVLKPDLVASTAPIQVCAGLQGGVEAAIHAMRRMYEDPDCQAVLLVDANNAFNSLNRKVALHNLRLTCPEFFKYVLNTYRQPSNLFVATTEEIILSQEGTTQGDTSAMGMYADSLMPLIECLKIQVCESLRQIFYADDAAAAGKLDNIKEWWLELQNTGPLYGYDPKPSKTWLIVKPEFYDTAKELFPDVNVTMKGHRYLGSYIGHEDGLAEFVEGEINEWKSDITGLAEIASSEPQLAYSAFVYGTSKRWNFLARTTPNISKLLYKLEYHIKDIFIPAILGKLYVPESLRSIFALPARMGGLGINNICETAKLEYKYSTMATQDLVDAIYHQKNLYTPDEDRQRKITAKIRTDRQGFYIQRKSELEAEHSPTVRRQLELLSEKGASCWLTSLPLKDYGFLLNKQEFQDALSLRYNLDLNTLDRPKLCICGQVNNVNHCLTCKLGGYVSLRHDSLKKTTGELLSKVCKDVTIEPALINITTEHLPSATNIADNARLDISARGFWTPLDRAFTDVRVLHPQAPSNSNKSLYQMYKTHENEKKNKYNARVLQVEKASFTPLVFSTTGGMGSEAERFYKHLAMKISNKSGQRYSDTITFIRRRLRFDLLRTCLISLRGFRGIHSAKPVEIDTLDLNLRPQGVY